ncbi:MAG TPA: phosphate ABC transporter permease subunit PstC [Chthonomonas sp.]|uniref:phosphate ABC transporter permease subunit PstC n=1 Tax=Chthonomonas sp. TaxID=2282153 RepID=UPI002B4B902F|nr:phosphate ABC transporter permease subunit PstC [Chthonomonas sp.]HLI47814.1 phosphate ABC transporter permease subunit PstC [Chthonomonas sp.]
MAQISLPKAHTPTPHGIGGRRVWVFLVDRLFRGTALLFALSTVVIILGIALSLVLASRQNVHHSGLRFFLGERWIPNPPTAEKPIGNVFGVLPFVYGTFVTSALALLLAVPIGVGSAIFLAELAPHRVNKTLSFFIEMLAAVPSIVYGYWGLLYLVPILQNQVEVWLNAHFGSIPFFASYYDTGTGMDFLAAGVVLSLMILPYVTAVSRDVLMAVPRVQREAAYGLGATPWEATKQVVLRYASSGIIGAVMLALGRALGETMAVTMVIGAKVTIAHLKDPASFSLLRSGYTMTSVLVDQYNGPNSPLHASALTEIALTLFLITIVVNGMARLLVWLTASGGGGTRQTVALRGHLIGFLRILLSLLVAMVLLYQIVHDMRSEGLRALLGPAEALAIFLLLLGGVNRWAPRTRFFQIWRRIGSVGGNVACFLCALLGAAALVWLFQYVFRAGFPALNAQFFRRPNPANPEAGGMLHAIVGTGILVAMASAVGVPTGILGGIYLSEFGKGRLGFWIRFFTDLLNGVPSIVVGIFVYNILVVPTHENFGYAGGIALGILMIPTVMRTTEELLKVVPVSLREASLALGATYARTVWKVVLPAARGGILTGILLAVARVAGETAPLLIVLCSINLWSVNPQKPLPSLPVQIYLLRNDNDPVALSQAWGAALVLVLLVIVTSLLARIVSARGEIRATN